jgi:hypothetical protein
MIVVPATSPKCPIARAAVRSGFLSAVRLRSVFSGPVTMFGELRRNSLLRNATRRFLGDSDTGSRAPLKSRPDHPARGR